MNKKEAIIKEIETKTLVGMKKRMSLLNDLTYPLFSEFMPLKKDIKHLINKSVLDVRIYPDNYFSSFDPSTTFIKMAAVEVAKIEDLPSNME